MSMRRIRAVGRIGGDASDGAKGATELDGAAVTPPHESPPIPSSPP